MGRTSRSKTSSKSPAAPPGAHARAPHPETDATPDPGPARRRSSSRGISGQSFFEFFLVAFILSLVCYHVFITQLEKYPAPTQESSQQAETLDVTNPDITPAEPVD